ncbi:metallophosphoesterase [Pasteurellaceae bacterium Macca]|nr:metallophosphoesterase [Pasteurellaceae bacterium Macca]
MEYRYYIITAVVVVLLQGLIFSFARTISWLGALSRGKEKAVMLVSFLTVNGLLLLHLTQTVRLFRPIALILALLMFAGFIRFLTWGLFYLGKKVIKKDRLQLALRITYPFAFIALVGLAVYNAYTPKVVRYDITLDKPLAQPLKIGVASDFHLGTLFGGKQLDELARIFEGEKVDLILLPGDIMDDNTTAYLAENMRPHLAKLRAPLGVYATLGNHDFFGEQQRIAEEIRQAGIQVLWDQGVNVAGKFTLIGRNDDLVRNRPSAKTLLKGFDTSQPIFLLDHRPTDIEKHAKLPIDLQVSGHTHKGQVFPASLITKMMYRLDYGYEKIGLGHYVVTSGYGFWGIPMRLGSQSEAVILHVKGR